jgi:hypothetical protein
MSGTGRGGRSNNGMFPWSRTTEDARMLVQYIQDGTITEETSAPDAKLCDERYEKYNLQAFRNGLKVAKDIASGKIDAPIYSDDANAARK